MATRSPSVPSPTLTVGVLLTAWVFAAAWMLFPYVMIDVSFYYIPWYQHVLAAGPIGAFNEPFSNYTPPYLYLLALAAPFAGLMPDAVIIKLLALAGHVLLALASFRLLRSLGVRAAAIGGAAVFALPTLFANPVLLGQCDALYAAPIVLALAAAIDRRHSAMLLWCGLALAIKLQAILIAPFFLALLLARHVPAKQWLLAPGGYIAAFVPAWLAGWPAADLATIYFRQAADFGGDVVLNAPNVWTLLPVPGSSGWATSLPLAITAAVAVAFLVSATARLKEADHARLIEFALLSVLIMAGLLPRMHERYFLLADLLALVLAFARPTRDTIAIAVLVQLGSIGALAAYVTGVNEFAQLGALAMIAATWVVAGDLFGKRREHATA